MWSLILALSVWLQWRCEIYLREQPLPQFLKRKLRETYPHLQQKDAELVERGLRQFFLACHRSNKKFVAMPSRAVDAMWHEFILHTHAYKEWCIFALGRFLHHTPAEALGTHADRNDGLRRAWWWACKDEGINPRQPTRLPLLFALDTKLGIPNGFTTSRTAATAHPGVTIQPVPTAARRFPTDRPAVMEVALVGLMETVGMVAVVVAVAIERIFVLKPPHEAFEQH